MPIEINHYYLYRCGLSSFAALMAGPDAQQLFPDPKRMGAIMNGSLLRFYVHEGHRHHHHLVWEWLLEQANKLGIRGGSAFRALAGFGRHHMLHEERFFELAGTLTVEIEFIVTDEEAQRLLALIHKEKIRLFYAHIPARFGVINPDSADPPVVALDQ